MRHTHRASRSKQNRELAGIPFPFIGPVGVKQNPKAHGGIRVVERCACGALRVSNVNGAHRERGEWERL